MLKKEIYFNLKYSFAKWIINLLQTKTKRSRTFIRSHFEKKKWIGSISLIFFKYSFYLFIWLIIFFCFLYIYTIIKYFITNIYKLFFSSIKDRNNENKEFNKNKLEFLSLIEIKPFSKFCSNLQLFQFNWKEYWI